jgi:hypothetical protein
MLPSIRDLIRRSGIAPKREVGRLAETGHFLLKGLGLPNESLDVGNCLRSQLQVRVRCSSVSRDVLHHLIFRASSDCKVTVLASVLATK